MIQNKWRISEKELEDWICANPERALWDGAKIIDRQVKLRHGILDVLAYDGRTLVIELKAGPIKEAHIGQVLRYKHDVSMELQRLSHYQCPIEPGYEGTFRNFYDAAFYEVYHLFHGWTDTCFSGDGEDMVHAFLYGTKVENHILAAAQAANITVNTWRFDDDAQTICTDWSGIIGWDNESQSFASWAQTISNLALNNCTEENHLWLRQHMKARQIVHNN